VTEMNLYNRLYSHLDFLQLEELFTTFRIPSVSIRCTARRDYAFSNLALFV